MAEIEGQTTLGEAAGESKPQKKVKKEHRLTVCEVTQALDEKYFIGWSDTEKDTLRRKDARGLLAVILCRLQQHGYIVQEGHLIIHDKDVQERWDERANAYVMDAKLEHFHCYIKFLKEDKKIYSGTVVQIAAAVGVASQFVIKGPAGRYTWDNMLAYAIHAKDAHKYQYDPSQVVSGGAFKVDKDTGIQTNLWTEYREIYATRKRDWEAGRAKKTAQRAVAGIDELEEKILCGEYTKNQVLLTDELFSIYARNKRRCDEAFEVYIARKIAKTVQAMESGEFKLSVYFITGKSHAGKSYFTDALAARIQADAKEKLGQDWSICGCAASNPFDDYDGSEILVMDDLRGVAMGASDWLKLLDPDRVNMASARYKNKRVAARVIIINSEKNVLDFFYYMKGSGGGDRSEAMDQFFRRIFARGIVYRVPDNLDARRVVIGHMQETEPFKLPEPGKLNYDGSPVEMTLHHNFLANELDMSFDDALAHMAGLVMDRNTPNKGGGVKQ